MAQDPASGSIPGDLPESVREWLADLAEETELSEAELLEQLSAASGEDAVTSGAATDELQARVSELETVIDEVDSLLRGRITEVEEEFEGKLEDVRERVIQVKREADAKAHANHSHRDLQTEIESLDAEVETLEQAIDELGDQLEATIETIAADQEALADRAEEIENKLDILANTMLELRSRTTEVSELGNQLAAVTTLADAANRTGTSEAKCEGCRATVDISLLTRPRCPHCQEPFSDFEPKGWFLGSNTLKTGSRPALEGAVAEEPDLSEMVEAAPEEKTDPVSRSDTAEAVSEDGQPAETDLRSIEGIGSSYADRLDEAGIVGVTQLATVDPEDLAEAIDVSPKLTSDWVEQARSRVRAD